MVSERLRSLVWERAEGKCEYCKLSYNHHPGPYQIDHVIAVKHNGQTVE
jgi:5-methylcytosine-specific restriction endonuclease McrA